MEKNRQAVKRRRQWLWGAPQVVTLEMLATARVRQLPYRRLLGVKGGDCCVVKISFFFLLCFLFCFVCLQYSNFYNCFS